MLLSSNGLGFRLEACVVYVRFDVFFTHAGAVNFQGVVRFAKMNLPVFNLTVLFQFVQMRLDLRRTAEAIDVRFKNVLAHTVRFRTLSPLSGTRPLTAAGCPAQNF